MLFILRNMYITFYHLLIIIIDIIYASTHSLYFKSNKHGLKYDDLF